MEDNTLFPSLMFSANSEDPILDPEACSANSSDQNEELMFSATASKGLEADSRQGLWQSSFLSLPLLRSCLKLLLYSAEAKLKIDWPD